MQIKRLEIAGFKSFLNPVGLDFGGGITAVLGPNGCGKSNVVDALRWVLGEQSAKQLRGEKMQNVIFNGTRARKPVGMAEVSIGFANTHGRLPVAYDEVRLTRRLSRDGQSEYLLNGAPCRLKDIKDLITDTGAGSHAYSIIEREMVDGVIHGHEESRRFLFEEASGIMKYRMRRKEALRKLEMTEQDLLRLNDILDEVARTVRALRRQMGRARRHQQLAEQLRKGETWMAQRRLLESRDEAAALAAQLDALRDDEIGVEVRDDTLEAGIEALRLEVTDTERAFRAAGLQAEEIAAALKGCEDTILVLRGRIESTRDARAAAASEVWTTEQRLVQVRAESTRLDELGRDCASRVETARAAFLARKGELETCEARFDGVRAELLDVKQRTFDFTQDAHQRRGAMDVLRVRLETLEARVRELQEETEAEADRGARLADEHAALSTRIEAVEASRAARRVALAAGVQRTAQLAGDLEAARDARAATAVRLEAARSRAELLRAMLEAHEGYGAGARTLLERHAGKGRVLGGIADGVQVPAGLEAAYEALLHDVVDALCVRDVDAALDLVQELRAGNLGRATLVLQDFGSAASPGDVPRDIPGVLGAAVDLLPEAGRHPALARLLADALIVEDAAAARAVLARGGARRLVTRDGTVLAASGAISGGASAVPDSSLLGRRQRLAALDAEAAGLERDVAQHAAHAAEIEAALQAERAAQVQLEAGIRVDDEEHQALAVSRAALETSIAEGSARRAQAGAQLGTLEGEAVGLAARMPELASAADAVVREGESHGRAVAAREAEFAAVESERERLRAEVGELRVAFVTAQGEAESQARQLERLGELERELADLCTRRQEEIGRAEADLERWTGELGAAERQGALHAERLGAARAAQNEIGVRLDAQRAALDAEQGRLHEIEKARREHQGQRHAAELALAENGMRRQNLLDRMHELYQIDEAGLAALQFEWTDEEPVPDDAALRAVRAAIADLGPVNLLALEEHEEKSQRLAFLETQRDDLVRASAALRETIDKINRTAHVLFIETFEQVRAHFRDTIRTVFDGGEGDLLMTSAEDPLDADVEILVRPRGKKIDTLAQLSSGERALTAIALLFSIYLVKPSPFCVFDEVDAPLDDANVLRFVALLQEFKDRTQFIVITHNKLTMEAADRLYGVTMEEEGVSKLVSVAMDGEVRGEPRALRRKTQRVRAAAVLQPAPEALAGAAAQIASPDDAAELLLAGADGGGGDGVESRV